MTNTENGKKDNGQKIAKFVGDKILSLKNHEISDEDSLIFWLANYYEKMVSGAKEKTARAKKTDIQKFLEFFIHQVGSYHIDYWTPSITKSFQKYLINHKSHKTGQGYKTTTINRIFATLKHAARWINERRVFKAGDPFKEVKDLMEDEPDWNGLTDRQLMLLRGACDQRIKICERKNQNPLLERAIFYVLLHTGMREFELCSLKKSQYYNKGFHDVKRKGRMTTRRIFIPDEARQKLDEYLQYQEEQKQKRQENQNQKDQQSQRAEQVDNNKESTNSSQNQNNADNNINLDEALFLNRYNNPLTEKDVRRICDRISNQACTYLKAEDKFKLKPHQLRHTFLKRANDKHGLSYTKKVSGNVGIKELFRYTAPSQQEVESKTEELFG